MPEPILARFPDRLKGALLQIKQMPKWLWPHALYDLVWPILLWEMGAATEEDSFAIIDAFGSAKDPEMAFWMLDDYLEKKLAEARQ